MQKNVSEKGISDKNPAGRREDPVGLRYALNVLYERYEKPLFIVENGFGAIDVKERDGSCDDSPRITYLKKHIQEMKKAVEEDGVDLMGYTPWGCIDLVSFTTGEMKKDMALFMWIKMMTGQEIMPEAEKNPFIGIRK